MKNHEEQKKDPLISVVIPVFNVEGYLKRCLDSVVKQDYKNLQIILVDDGSSDDSGRICEEYASEDSRIEVIHQPNGGLVSARKAGLKSAAGEYIGFVDGDDYIEHEMYQVLLGKLLEDRSDFIHSGYKKGHHLICGVQKEAIYRITKDNSADLISKIIFGSTGDKNISPSCWSKLFKRELIMDSYMSVPDTQVYGEDLLSLCGCMLRCRKISVINQAFYHYVTRNDSICHERTMTNLTREYGLYRCLCGLFENYHMLPLMQESVDKYFLRGLSGSLGSLTGIPHPIYQYPDMDGLFGKKIAIFGAGEVGLNYYLQMSRYQQCRIVAWADTHCESFQYDFCDVIGIRELSKKEFDVIVIGVLTGHTADMIRNQLVDAGIHGDKIRWRRPEYLY